MTHWICKTELEVNQGHNMYGVIFFGLDEIYNILKLTDFF